MRLNRPPSRSGQSRLLPGKGPLAKVSPLTALLGVFALMAVGIWLRGPLGAALLGLLTLAVLTLLLGTWQVLAPAERVIRIIVLAILAAITVNTLH